MIKQFFKDGFLYAATSFISKSISLLLLPFYVRVISQEYYGLLDLILLLTNLINLTFSLELTQGMARFLPVLKSNKARRIYISSGWWVVVVSYSIFVILYLSTIGIFESYYYDMDLDFPTHILIGLYVITNGLFLYTQNNLRWLMKSMRFASVSLVFTIATISFSIFFVLVMNLGFKGILLGNVIGASISMVLAIWNLRESYGMEFSVNHLKKILRFSSPLVLSSLAVYISLYADRLIINSQLGLKEVAIFGVAYRFSSVLLLLTTGFSSALTPIIYRDHKNETVSKDLTRLFNIFLSLGIGITWILFIFSEEILLFFTTPEYIGAGFLIPILSMAVLCNSFYVFYPGLIIAKKTKVLALYNSMTAFLNIVLCFVLIDKFGVIGIAFATLLSSIIGFALNLTGSLKFYKQQIDIGRILVLLLVFSAFVLTALFYKDAVFLGCINIFNLLTKLLVTLCLFTIIGIIFRKEFGQLRRLKNS